MATMGFMLGTVGFVFALIALAKIGNLEKKLKEVGVIDKEFNSDNTNIS